MFSQAMLPDNSRKFGEGGEQQPDPTLPIGTLAMAAEQLLPEEAGRRKEGQPLLPCTASADTNVGESAPGKRDVPRRYTFPAHLRLKRAAEFERCFAHKVSTADDVLIVYGYPSQLPYPRLGCVVSRKWGRAVRRNRLKRLLREAFRLSQHELPAGIDYVVLPRLTGEVPHLEAIRHSLMRLARRLARRLAGASSPPSPRQPPAPQELPPVQEPPRPPASPSAQGSPGDLNSPASASPWSEEQS